MHWEFFFCIIEYNCGKSIYMGDVFLSYDWGGYNVWKWLFLSHKRHTYFNKSLCWNIINLGLSTMYDHSTYSQKKQLLKKSFVWYIRTINLSLNELKLIAKSRSIKDYKNKSEEYLTKILSDWKPKMSLFKKKLEEIKKDLSELRHRFLIQK